MTRLNPLIQSSRAAYASSSAARLDSSRTTPGHGLGLNLVEVIAEAHGGALSIDDNMPGLRVTMVLPRAQG